MLSSKQQKTKRLFDLIISLIGIVISSIPLIILVLLSSISTRSFGIFFQERVGKDAEFFILYKIKTFGALRNGEIFLTWFGKFLRKSKFDELPQLFNVLFGNMSMVGPRPDIQGYADKLKEADRIILSVKPGITGPATLKFSNEEELLSEQENPLEFNDKFLWPQKIEINKCYVQEWKMLTDFRCLLKTLRHLF
jgi:lipopolysaccharide/colanic/teichoic acid biosynthesis glycosyltransferase|tara:strand:+ start:1110 stop:1691 length:582 start_codon:yes stop_codon:yes gene_type:complete